MLSCAVLCYAVLCCAVLYCALPSHVMCRAVSFQSLLHSSNWPVSKFWCHSRLAGDKLDARAAIAGRYISLEEPNTDTTASTSGRDSTTTSNHHQHQQQQQQQQQQMYWESGLFDKDSWVETHPGWAKSVVTGRARLGGMPCGERDITLSLQCSICPVRSTLFNPPCSICPALAALLNLPCDMNKWFGLYPPPWTAEGSQDLQNVLANCRKNLCSSKYPRAVDSESV